MVVNLIVFCFYIYCIIKIILFAAVSLGSDYFLLFSNCSMKPIFEKKYPLVNFLFLIIYFFL